MRPRTSGLVGGGSSPDVNRSGQFGQGCLQPGRVVTAQFHDGLAGDYVLTWLGLADDSGGRRHRFARA